MGSALEASSLPESLLQAEPRRLLSPPLQRPHRGRSGELDTVLLGRDSNDRKGSDRHGTRPLGSRERRSRTCVSGSSELGHGGSSLRKAGTAPDSDDRARDGVVRDHEAHGDQSGQHTGGRRHLDGDHWSAARSEVQLRSLPRSSTRRHRARGLRRPKPQVRIFPSTFHFPGHTSGHDLAPVRSMPLA